jgi:hypothetical protein
MAFRTPSYHTVCVIAGASMAALFELTGPEAASFLDVCIVAGVGALIGHSLGETPVVRRSGIHRGALAGIGIGAIISIVRQLPLAATFGMLFLCLLAGTLVARSGWIAVLYMLKWTAAGLVGGLLWAQINGLPLLVTTGRGGLLLAFLALIRLAFSPIGQETRKLDATEKQRIRTEIDHYKHEIERSLIPYRQRSQRGQAGNVQQSRGEDSSEES